MQPLDDDLQRKTKEVQAVSGDVVQ